MHKPGKKKQSLRFEISEINTEIIPVCSKHTLNPQPHVLKTNIYTHIYAPTNATQ